MKYFNYRNGHLFAEEVGIAQIADRVGTPFFCYSSSALEKQYDSLNTALHPLNANICYAVKANSNQAVIKTLAARGSGADVVSKGELLRALAAGIPAHQIVFSGVGKTAEEIHFALTERIGQFNVESLPELELISNIASKMGSVAPVALRVNPDVDAETHEKISTGRKTDKFGIDIEDTPELYGRATKMSGLKTVGLAIHIGSQLTSLKPFRYAFERLSKLVQVLRTSGHSVTHVDLGGGLGVNYIDETPPTPMSYAKVINETIGGLDVEITVEPGRFLVANAGILVSKVIFIKETAVHRFVIVDAAMNDFIRPTLYDAEHCILCEKEVSQGVTRPAQIVGPVCETGDILVREVNLPNLTSHDLIALCSAGAYGAVMGSSYNTRLPTPEVLVKDQEFSIIRPRPTYSHILSLDRIPSWL